jgi:hypothetical protein
MDHARHDRHSTVRRGRETHNLNFELCILHYVRGVVHPARSGQMFLFVRKRFAASHRALIGMRRS